MFQIAQQDIVMNWFSVTTWNAYLTHESNQLKAWLIRPAIFTRSWLGRHVSYICVAWKENWLHIFVTQVPNQKILLRSLLWNMRSPVNCEVFTLQIKQIKWASSCQPNTYKHEMVMVANAKTHGVKVSEHISCLQYQPVHLHCPNFRIIVQYFLVSILIPWTQRDKTRPYDYANHS